MSEFAYFCELIDVVTEQAKALEEDTPSRVTWPRFNDNIELLVSKIARLRARATEPDPDKRIYGPETAAKVLAQLARVEDLLKRHALIGEKVAKQEAEQATSLHLAEEATQQLQPVFIAGEAQQSLKNAISAQNADEVPKFDTGVIPQRPSGTPAPLPPSSFGLVTSPQPALSQVYVESSLAGRLVDCSTTRWHCWRHPDVSIRSVLAIGVYAHPADSSEHPGWQV